MKSAEADRDSWQRKSEQLESKVSQLAQECEQAHQEILSLRAEKEELEIQSSFTASQKKADKAASAKAKISIKTLTGQLNEQKIALSRFETLLESQKSEYHFIGSKACNFVTDIRTPDCHVDWRESESSEAAKSKACHTSRACATSSVRQ
jgi:chromosome segregation ATPase